MVYARCFDDVCGTFGPFYPANHSPSKIETKKNRENLQVPAGVVLCNLCLEPMRVLEQVHRNAVVMWATPIENGSLPQGGHGLTNTQIQNRLKRVFKLTVAFSTPIENQHKNSTSFCVCVGVVGVTTSCSCETTTS